MATLFLVTLSLIYFLIPLKEIYKAPILFIIFIPLLPLTFIFQNKHPIDKKIGNLSYPIYIGHLLVIMVIGYFAKCFSFSEGFFVQMANVIFSITFAFLLDRFVAKKVEKWRSRIRCGSPVIAVGDIVSPQLELDMTSVKVVTGARRDSDGDSGRITLGGENCGEVSTALRTEE